VIRTLCAAAVALAALVALPAAAAGHSLVRVNGNELAYISADAVSLNTLEARVRGGDYELRDATVDGGSDPGPCRPGEITPDANAYIVQVFCRRAGIERLRVDLGEREDSAVVNLPIPITLLGGPGADRLVAGSAADSVQGGDGNDRLDGGGGDDQLDGGEGVDTFEGGPGSDVVRSADGLAERVSCGAGEDRVEADTFDDVAADCENVSRTAVAPPIGGDGTGSDDVAPVVQAGASTLQRLTSSGRVLIAATSSERGFLSASGRLVARGLALPIQSDRRRVTVAGGGATLTVKLRGRALREARRALKRKKPVTVRLGVVASDTAGNSAHVAAPRIRLTNRGGAARAAAARAAAARAAAARSALHPEPGDIDGDGVWDWDDNCPEDRNGDQRDTDGDGPGDACDPDMDGDGHGNDVDNCPPVANADQSVNPCTEDPDGDGVPTFRDNCFDVANPDQRNNDFRFPYGDGLGDACDPDDDGDGVFDDVDNCPLVENPDQTDADGDGRGYLCDADDTPAPSEPGGGGPGGGPGGPGEERDTTAPRVTARIGRRLKLAVVEAGLVVPVRCSEGCAVTATLTAGRKLARKLKLPRSGIAARGTAQLERAARTYAFVRFSKAAKRRVWRRKSTKLTLRVVAVDRAGNRGRAVRAVTLRR
jgi:Ca2+-binding RTX toxin-like protein